MYNNNLNTFGNTGGLTYLQARDMLDSKRGDKNIKRIANNTYLHRHEDYVAIRLHDTDIIKLYPEAYELYTGGWHTPTTKDRLNTYAPYCYITQRKSIWYMRDGSIFYDGIKLDYGGNIISVKQEPEKKIKEFTKIKKQIKTYADNFIKSTDFDTVIPSNGDCWFCALRTVDNMSMGDVSNNKQHLLDHMAEKYYVPSLMVNALVEAGYNSPATIIRMAVTDSIQRSIVKYMQKRLLPY